MTKVKNQGATLKQLFTSRPKCGQEWESEQEIGLPCWPSGEESACQWRRCRLDSWIRKIPLEKGMGTHSSIRAWEIPWTEESDSYSPWGGKRVGHDLATK